MVPAVTGVVIAVATSTVVAAVVERVESPHVVWAVILATATAVWWQKRRRQQRSGTFDSGCSECGSGGSGCSERCTAAVMKALVAVVAISRVITVVDIELALDAVKALSAATSYVSCILRTVQYHIMSSWLTVIHDFMRRSVC